jgi:ABC-2 type transport system permease protein
MSGLPHALRVVGALSKRSIKQTFRRPQLLAPILLFPSLFLAANSGGAQRATDIPGFPDVNGFFDFELPAAMLQATMLAGVSGGIALALDFELRFVDRLFAAPIPRWAIVIGRLAATGVMGVIVGVWFVAAGLIFGAKFEGGVPGMVLIVALTGLCAAGFGGLGAALAIWKGQASFVQGMFPFVFVILFLSTAFFPANLMLEPAGTFAEWNPLSPIADGLREPIVYGLSAEPILKCLAAIAALGLVGLLASALALRSRLRTG